MIYPATSLKVCDNSGAQLVSCIQVLKKPSGTIGDKLILTVKKTLPRKQNKVSKGMLVKGLICETKKGYLRKDGSFLKFDRNAIALISDKNLPIGTRISGYVPYEFRKKKFLKFLSIAKKNL